MERKKQELLRSVIRLIRILRGAQGRNPRSGGGQGGRVVKLPQIHYFHSEIEKTDKKIDEAVYELYGLTEEEIGVVEETRS